MKQGMMKTARTGLLVAAMVAGPLAAATPARAATFVFAYSGAGFGNNATATGSFDIADSALATVNAGGLPAYGSISNLTMTVAGAGTTAGNGVFRTGDFATFLFWSPGALDFTRQLVGQSLGNGLAFGRGGVGEFNFFAATAHAPLGLAPFTLAADRGLGARMTLTSLVSTTAVPEPASWAMMILGLGGIGFAIRRHRKATRVSFAT